MQRLSSENAVLRTANDKCAVNVKAVKAGVKEVTDVLDAKKHAADAAMKDAQYWASKHSTLAEEVNSFPFARIRLNARRWSGSRESMFKPALSHDAPEQIL